MEAGAVAAGEDEMVEDRAVERFGGAGQAAGGTAVGGARPRIAARVIVGKDDPGAFVPGGVGDDRPQREVGAVDPAVVMADMEATGSLVDMGDPQPLTGRVG